MQGRLRKFALTVHVACSVGWLGAVITSLVIAVAGLTSQDVQTVRAAYVILEVIGWTVLLPLSLASLLTGLVQSLGTAWGLFRHYWVIAKLLMNLFATAVLLLYLRALDYFGDLAMDATTAADLRSLRDPSPVLQRPEPCCCCSPLRCWRYTSRGA
ncbi:MAG: hypothetical protein L0Y54_13090 [Sporichthyaceae bacterium]|nr:hypothetical protein [Sporichthyaceae bacterium]